jgi:hypothetical protein
MALTSNRLSITLTPAAITAIKAAIATVDTQLPFLLGLTNAERKAIPKIDVNNKVFVEDALTAINNNGGILPTYINAVEIGKDLELFEQLDELVQLVGQLYDKLKDTQMLAGSEAYVSSLVAYKLFASAADAGLPGAESIYNQLKQRFITEGGGDNTTPNG